MVAKPHDRTAVELDPVVSTIVDSAAQARLADDTIHVGVDKLEGERICSVALASLDVTNVARQ